MDNLPRATMVSSTDSSSIPTVAAEVINIDSIDDILEQLFWQKYLDPERDTSYFYEAIEAIMPIRYSVEHYRSNPIIEDINEYLSYICNKQRIRGYIEYVMFYTYKEIFLFRILASYHDDISLSSNTIFELWQKLILNKPEKYSLTDTLSQIDLVLEIAQEYLYLSQSDKKVLAQDNELAPELLLLEEKISNLFENIKDKLKLHEVILQYKENNKIRIFKKFNSIVRGIWPEDITQEDLYATDINGDTLLTVAIRMNHKSIVQKILELDSDDNHLLRLLNPINDKKQGILDIISPSNSDEIFNLVCSKRNRLHDRIPGYAERIIELHSTSYLTISEQYRELSYRKKIVTGTMQPDSSLDIDFPKFFDDIVSAVIWKFYHLSRKSFYHFLARGTNLSKVDAWLDSIWKALTTPTYQNTRKFKTVNGESIAIEGFENKSPTSTDIQEKKLFHHGSAIFFTNNRGEMIEEKTEHDCLKDSFSLLKKDAFEATSQSDLVKRITVNLAYISSNNDMKSSIKLILNRLYKNVLRRDQYFYDIISFFLTDITKQFFKDVYTKVFGMEPLPHYSVNNFHPPLQPLSDLQLLDNIANFIPQEYGRPTLRGMLSEGYKLPLNTATIVIVERYEEPKIEEINIAAIIDDNASRAASTFKIETLDSIVQDIEGDDKLDIEQKSSIFNGMLNCDDYQGNIAQLYLNFARDDGNLELIDKTIDFARKYNLDNSAETDEFYNGITFYQSIFISALFNKEASKEELQKYFNLLDLESKYNLQNRLYDSSTFMIVIKNLEGYINKEVLESFQMPVSQASSSPPLR
jgi:hypothetical protein